jgi:hypothetical protein
VVCDNRSCMRNIRSEINYCLGNRSLVVSMTNLADLQAGKRGEGDSVWLEARNRGLYCLSEDNEQINGRVQPRCRAQRSNVGCNQC